MEWNCQHHIVLTDRYHTMETISDLFRAPFKQRFDRGPPEYWTLEWVRACGAMKMSKSCKEVTVAKPKRSVSEGCRFKTRCKQGLFAAESPLKSCDLYAKYQYIHKMDVLVGCTFALHKRKM